MRAYKAVIQEEKISVANGLHKGFSAIIYDPAGVEFATTREYKRKSDLKRGLMKFFTPDRVVVLQAGDEELRLIDGEWVISK